MRYTVRLRQEGFCSGLPAEAESRQRVASNWRGETTYWYTVDDRYTSEFEAALQEDWRVESWHRME